MVCCCCAVIALLAEGAPPEICTQIAPMYAGISPSTDPLGQAKLIHSLSSGIFENYMRAGGHFSYFIT